MKNPVNILYILGDGRSGSTLLDLLVSSHADVQGLGEMKCFHRYNPSIPNPKKCTCGLRLDECHLWGSVLDDLTYDYSISLNEETNFVPRNYELLKKITEINGAYWVCDSSKDPVRLDLLLADSSFAVKIIHLVRDPRAVAFSNLRKRKRVLKSRGFSLNTYLKYGYLKSLFLWEKHNVLYQEKYGHLSEYYFLRYEDLTDNYESVIFDIWNQMGLNTDGSNIENRTKAIHNIGGNHMRRQDSFEVKKDQEFKGEISNFTWLLSSKLISSALDRFGYSQQKKYS